MSAVAAMRNDGAPSRPMRQRGRPRLAAAIVALAATLAGCAGPSAPPRSFQPLDYDYLTKLRLNVARIDVDANWVPRGGQQHVEYLAPTPPLRALALMAQQRLVPAGSAGNGLFVVDDASLVQDRSTYLGRFAVHLNLFDDEQHSLGTAEAQVTGVHPVTGRDQNAVRADLYDLTRTLMDAMNVELEFQLRRSMRDQLQATSPDAPLPASVETQTLAPPPGTQPSDRQPAASPTDLSPATPGMTLRPPAP